jgi:hypothetical protein
MVSVRPMFPIHGERVRHVLLAAAFVVTAAMGALAATVFTDAASTPRVAAPPAGAHVGLYVQIQSSQAAAPQSAVRHLFLQTVVVDSGRDAVPAPAVQDFTVRAADGRTWPVGAAAAFSTGALQPGEQRGMSLFADLPASASGLRLVMQNHGQTVSVPLVW